MAFQGNKTSNTSTEMPSFECIFIRRGRKLKSVIRALYVGANEGAWMEDVHGHINDLTYSVTLLRIRQVTQTWWKAATSSLREGNAYRISHR